MSGKEDQPRRHQVKRPCQLSVEDVFLLLRRDMGHTWPLGTFNSNNRSSQDPTGENTIDVEFRVVEEPKELKPGTPTTQQPDNPSPEVTRG